MRGLDRDASTLEEKSKALTRRLDELEERLGRASPDLQAEGETTLPDLEARIARLHGLQWPLRESSLRSRLGFLGMVFPGLCGLGASLVALGIDRSTPFLLATTIVGLALMAAVLVVAFLARLTVARPDQPGAEEAKLQTTEPETGP